jgi:rfaE bifunctional protein nucleotidyltransferase chain/domain/rfaE bifunctional protein kinase chain/domain
MRLVVVGDALLDRDLCGSVERICPDAPVPVIDETDLLDRPGGAALSAWLAADDPATEVVLVAAPGSGRGADRLAELVTEAGVDWIPWPGVGTVAEKVRVRAGGQSLLRIDRGGCTPRPGPVPAAVGAAVARADVLLVSDYGRGLVALPALRALLDDVGRRRPLVWDPHPRGPLPVAGTWLATPNEAEVRSFAPDIAGEGLAGVARRARRLLDRFGGRSVAVTRGTRGAVLVSQVGAPLAVPAMKVDGGDACGAGDAFAAAAAAALARRGVTLGEAVEEAVDRAGRFVGLGGAAGVTASRSSGPNREGGRRGREQRDTALVDVGAAEAMIRDVQAAGGTVVATGGCFDLLHPGHVRLLRDARRLGDLLVVLLNSDSSITRLKGPGRPVQPLGDRAEVLAALDAVDAVVAFDDDTPVPLLGHLRPDIFTKGADYASADLPEAAAARAWGGEVVVLPYRSGHSTSRLVEASRVR